MRSLVLPFPSADKAVVRDLPLEEIKLDQCAQPRDHLSTEIVQEYAEAMAAGAQFPPLVVFFDGETYWLADGFHRHYAALGNEIRTFPCEIRRGGLRDAILFSCGANAAHGYKRSNADKRHAVMRLLHDEEWTLWPERDIARQCAVSHTFVQNLRQEYLATLPDKPSERITTRGGTTYKMDTSNIGRGEGSRGSQPDDPRDEQSDHPPSSGGPTGSLFGDAVYQEDQANNTREEPAVWTPSQEERKRLAEKGTTVVASMRDNVDGALIEWAKATGRMVRIDRMSQWGNPYEMPGDGDRTTVIESYKLYFDRKYSLHRKLPDLLGGKVLVCWCHPEPCHGDFLCNEADKGGNDEQR